MAVPLAQARAAELVFLNYQRLEHHGAEAGLPSSLLGFVIEAGACGEAAGEWRRFQNRFLFHVYVVPHPFGTDGGLVAAWP